MPFESMAGGSALQNGDGTIPPTLNTHRMANEVQINLIRHSGEAHLRRILREYSGYHPGPGALLTLAKDAPNPRAVQPPERRSVVQVPEERGLRHRYERRAA